MLKMSIAPPWLKSPVVRLPMNTHRSTSFGPNPRESQGTPVATRRVVVDERAAADRVPADVLPHPQRPGVEVPAVHERAVLHDRLAARVVRTDHHRTGLAVLEVRVPDLDPPVVVVDPGPTTRRLAVDEPASDHHHVAVGHEKPRIRHEPTRSRNTQSRRVTLPR